MKNFLSCIPERLQKSIKAVCCDMYEGYISAVKEVSGEKAAVAADRFHVAELYGKDSETLRKQEMKRLKKKLPDKEYEKLKGAMRALRKNESEPGSDESEVLRRLFRHSPLLKTAYELCGELTYIFNRRISEDKAEKEIGIRAEPVRLDDCNPLDERLQDINWGNLFPSYEEGLSQILRVLKKDMPEEQEVKPPPKPVQPIRQPNKPKIPTWLTVIVLSAIIIAGIIGFYPSESQKKPESPIKPTAKSDPPVVATPPPTRYEVRESSGRHVLDG